MQKTDTIQSLNINDLIAATGRIKGVNDFYLFKSGELDRERKMKTPVRIDHFIIVIALEGSAHLRLNLKNYYVKKDALLIISPHTIHEFMEEKDSSFIAMGFPPAFFSHAGMHTKDLESFTFFSSQNDPCYFLKEKEASALLQIMYLLHDKYRYDDMHPFKDELIHHAFALFMYELVAVVRQHRNLGDIKTTRKENILMSFLNALPLYFKEERSVQFYASLLYITPKHLTKTVKELTNKTCGELIDEMVIIEAKVLLKDPAHSIANVAEQLHFSDQFFFSKFFKKNTGLTPTEFRTGADTTLRVAH